MLCLLSIPSVILGADPPPAPVEQSAAEETIVVRGRNFESVRLQIERAEDAVFARFNEINSNDLYDIHCYERTRIGSHIQERACVSNASRASDAAIGEGLLRGLQSGAPGGGGDSARAQARNATRAVTERHIAEEMAELVRSDPELEAAMVRLGQAYQVREMINDASPEVTLFREVTAGEAGLPGDAERQFDVRIGRADWSHALGARLFTIAGVNGRIRQMRLSCAGNEKKLDYLEDVEWMVPDAWENCTLSVSATRGTSFSLYEFE